MVVHNVFLLTMYVCIKIYDSESLGQEEVGRTRQMSELFTGSTTLKLINALNNLP